MDDDTKGSGGSTKGAGGGVDPALKAPLQPPPRRIRHIMPFGPRVLVRLIEAEDRSPAGLFLPQGVADEHEDALYGEVIEVARASADDDAASLGENVSGVPAGAYVLFEKDMGVRVPWDGKLRIVETGDILALVEEVDYEEAH